MTSPSDLDTADKTRAGSAVRLPAGKEIRTLLSEAQSGTTLIVAGKGVADALSLGGLVCRGLATSWRRLTGAASLFSCGAPEGNAFGEHVTAWDEAGGLFERLRADLESGTRYTHVFAIGSWAAAVVQPISQLLPGAKLIVVDDSSECGTADEDSYWNDVRTWLEHLKGVIIPIRDMFRALPSPAWPIESLDRLAKPLKQELQGRRVILLDEAGDQPPVPEVLEAVLKQWRQESERVILLSRHASFYAQKYAELNDGRITILDTRSLAAQVYAALLRCADAYLAPTGCPFGEEATQCIRPGSQQLIIGNDARLCAGASPSVRLFRDVPQLLEHLNHDVRTRGTGAGFSGTNDCFARAGSKL